MPHRDVHNPSGAADLVSGEKVGILAQQNHADFVFIHVEGYAEHTPGKFEQFLVPRAGKARYGGNSRGHSLHGADFPRFQTGGEAFNALPDGVKGFFIEAPEILCSLCPLRPHRLSFSSSPGGSDVCRFFGGFLPDREGPFNEASSFPPSAGEGDAFFPGLIRSSTDSLKDSK